ncbi:hypothetical protein NWO25_08810 [Enterococcus lactis]|nr:hypothetical protein [Enterococcus lactis]
MMMLEKNAGRTGTTAAKEAIICKKDAIQLDNLKQFKNLLDQQQKI